MVGGIGVVRVGDLEVTITPLTQLENRALGRQLRAEAEKNATDHFTRCSKLLKAMKSEPVAYLEAIREITRLTSTTSVSDEQFLEYRSSPAGVALELFSRGKKATEGLTREGLEAIITVANVDEIEDQMQTIIEGPPGPNA